MKNEKRKNNFRNYKNRNRVAQAERRDKQEKTKIVSFEQKKERICFAIVLILSIILTYLAATFLKNQNFEEENELYYFDTIEQTLMKHE